jgi:hypothetical protein
MQYKTVVDFYGICFVFLVFIGVGLYRHKSHYSRILTTVCPIEKCAQEKWK